jgi:hypothetical protein
MRKDTLLTRWAAVAVFRTLVGALFGLSLQVQAFPLQYEMVLDSLLVGRANLAGDLSSLTYVPPNATSKLEFASITATLVGGGETVNWSSTIKFARTVLSDPGALTQYFVSEVEGHHKVAPHILESKPGPTMSLAGWGDLNTFVGVPHVQVLSLSHDGHPDSLRAVLRDLNPGAAGVLGGGREIRLNTDLSHAPVPATIPLLGLGLAALGFSRRKHKREE